MAQWVRAPAIKTDNLSHTPRTYMVESENWHLLTSIYTPWYVPLCITKKLGSMAYTLELNGRLSGLASLMSICHKVESERRKPLGLSISSWLQDPALPEFLSWIPSVMDYYCQRASQINPLLPNLLLVMVFQQSNHNHNWDSEVEGLPWVQSQLGLQSKNLTLNKSQIFW